MTAGRQWRFWVWGLVIFIALVWLLRSMLAPFVAGMALAYLLDPVTDRLERHMPRWAATSLVLLGFAMTAVLALLLLVPLLQEQIVQLIDAAPQWVAWAKRELLPQIHLLIANDMNEEAMVRNLKLLFD